MNVELPEFEKLREMAVNDPEGLERLRARMCDQLIQDAPEHQRRRLRGLQFRIDMERERAKSPMSACIAISGMMHESFDQLREALNRATGRPTAAPQTASEERDNPAKVLPFRRA